jgi:hypothetical protein
MKFLIILFTAVAILWIGTAVVFAQPPGLPSAPSQAPIDGGLGLLAAAGGAYAFKRLRGKKSEKELQNL